MNADMQPAVLPPHDLETEQAVLGAILLSDRSLYGLVIEAGLRPEDFYSDHHAQIYAAMLSLYDDGAPVDILTVADRLRAAGTLTAIGGQDVLDRLTVSVPAVGHAHRYAQIVRDAAVARSALRISHQIQTLVAERGHDAASLTAEVQRLALTLISNRQAARQRTLQEAASDLLDRMQVEQNQDGLPGISTGLPGLDHALGGLHDGRLYIIAARPSMGKSALALQFARDIAQAGHRTLFVPLEMSDQDTAERHLITEAGIDPERLRLRRIRQPEWASLLRSVQRLEGMPMHILDDPAVGVAALRAEARQSVLRHGPLRCIVVDYLQLMAVDAPTGNRTRDVGELSRGLKQLAREMRCPVIAAAQINRAVEARNDRRPQLADLRESGDIENDANAVLMLYRDDYYNGAESERPGIMELIIRKNRDGPSGDTIELQEAGRLRWREASSSPRVETASGHRMSAR